MKNSYVSHSPLVIRHFDVLNRSTPFFGDFLFPAYSLNTFAQHWFDLFKKDLIQAVESSKEVVLIGFEVSLSPGSDNLLNIDEGSLSMDSSVITLGPQSFDCSEDGWHIFVANQNASNSSHELLHLTFKAENIWSAADLYVGWINSLIPNFPDVNPDRSVLLGFATTYENKVVNFLSIKNKAEFIKILADHSVQNEDKTKLSFLNANSTGLGNSAISNSEIVFFADSLDQVRLDENQFSISSLVNNSRFSIGGEASLINNQNIGFSFNQNKFKNELKFFQIDNPNFFFIHHQKKAESVTNPYRFLSFTSDSNSSSGDTFLYFNKEISSKIGFGNRATLDSFLQIDDDGLKASSSSNTAGSIVFFEDSTAKNISFKKYPIVSNDSAEFSINSFKAKGTSFIETGTLTNVDQFDQTVVLSRKFNDPVIFLSSSNSNTYNTSARVTGIDQTQPNTEFSVRSIASKATGQVNSFEDIFFIVIESGFHFIDGKRLEVGKSFFKTNRFQEKNTRIHLSKEYDEPVVILSEQVTKSTDHFVTPFLSYADSLHIDIKLTNPNSENGLLLSLYDSSAVTTNLLAQQIVDDLYPFWGQRYRDTPLPNIESDFTAIFSGKIYIPEGGKYFFRLLCDEQGELDIDGIINFLSSSNSYWPANEVIQETASSPQWEQRSVYLSEGYKDFELRLRNSTSRWQIFLQWCFEDTNSNRSDWEFVNPKYFYTDSPSVDYVELGWMVLENGDGENSGINFYSSTFETQPFTRINSLDWLSVGGNISGFPTFSSPYNLSESYHPSINFRYGDGLFLGLEHSKGANYFYYNLQNFSELVEYSTSSNIQLRHGSTGVDFNHEGLIEEHANNEFAILFFTFLYIPDVGLYEFSFQANDNGYVYIDGQLKDNFTGDVNYRYFNHNFISGFHSVVIAYNKGGSAGTPWELNLKWLPPFEAGTIGDHTSYSYIPDIFLFSTQFNNGLLFNFWNEENFGRVQIHKNKGVSNLQNALAQIPDSGLEKFSLELNGWIYFPVSGNYSFRLESEEESYLFLDNIENGSQFLNSSNAIPSQGSFNAPASGFYKFRFFYRKQFTSHAFSILWRPQWEDISSSFSEIPTCFLFINDNFDILPVQKINILQFDAYGLLRGDTIHGGFDHFQINTTNTIGETLSQLEIRNDLQAISIGGKTPQDGFSLRSSFVNLGRDQQEIKLETSRTNGISEIAWNENYLLDYSSSRGAISLSNYTLGTKRSDFLVSPLNGNVGISHSSPRTKLHLNTNSSGFIEISPTELDAGLFLHSQKTSGQSDNLISFQIMDSTGGSFFLSTNSNSLLPFSSASSLDQFVLGNLNNSNTLGYNLSLQTSGEVGFNHTSPQTDLHLNQEIQLSSSRSSYVGNQIFFEASPNQANSSGGGSFGFMANAFGVSSTLINDNDDLFFSFYDGLKRTANISIPRSEGVIMLGGTRDDIITPAWMTGGFISLGEQHIFGKNGVKGHIEFQLSKNVQSIAYVLKGQKKFSLKFQNQNFFNFTGNSDWLSLNFDDTPLKFGIGTKPIFHSHLHSPDNNLKQLLVTKNRKLVGIRISSLEQNEASSSSILFQINQHLDDELFKVRTSKRQTFEFVTQEYRLPEKVAFQLAKSTDLIGFGTDKLNTNVQFSRNKFSIQSGTAGNSAIEFIPQQKSLVTNGAGGEFTLISSSEELFGLSYKAIDNYSSLRRPNNAFTVWGKNTIGETSPISFESNTNRIGFHNINPLRDFHVSLEETHFTNFLGDLNSIYFRTFARVAPLYFFDDRSSSEILFFESSGQSNGASLYFHGNENAESKSFSFRLFDNNTTGRTDIIFLKPEFEQLYVSDSSSKNTTAALFTGFRTSNPRANFHLITDDTIVFSLDNKFIKSDIEFLTNTHTDGATAALVFKDVANNQGFRLANSSRLHSVFDNPFDTLFLQGFVGSTFGTTYLSLFKSTGQVGINTESPLFQRHIQLNGTSDSLLFSNAKRYKLSVEHETNFETKLFFKENKRSRFSVNYDEGILGKLSFNYFDNEGNVSNQLATLYTTGGSIWLEKYLNISRSSGRLVVGMPEADFYPYTELFDYGQLGQDKFNVIVQNSSGNNLVLSELSTNQIGSNIFFDDSDKVNSITWTPFTVNSIHNLNAYYKDTLGDDDGISRKPSSFGFDSLQDCNYLHLRERRPAEPVTDFVSFGDINIISGSVTLEAWVRYETLQKHGRIFDIGNGQSDNNIYLGLDGTSKRIIFAVFDGATGQSLATSQDIELEQWYHIAATFDASNQQAQIFVNGSLYRHSTFPIASVPNVVRSSNFIGQSNWPTNDGQAELFIKEARIWDLARTPEQIFIYKSLPIDPETPGLVLHYDFSEGTGTTVNNLAFSNALLNGSINSFDGSNLWESKQTPYGGLYINHETNKTIVQNNLKTTNYVHPDDEPFGLSSSSGLNIRLTHNGDLAISRVSDIEIFGKNWGAETNFEAYLSGTLFIPETGVYKFKNVSASRQRVFFENTSTMKADDGNTREFEIFLYQGKIKLNIFVDNDAFGDWSSELLWQKPGDSAYQNIPPDFLGQSFVPIQSQKLNVGESENKGSMIIGDPGISYIYLEWDPSAQNLTSLPDFLDYDSSKKEIGLKKQFDLSPQRRAYFGYEFFGYLYIKETGLYDFSIDYSDAVSWTLYQRNQDLNENFIADSFTFRIEDIFLNGYESTLNHSQFLEKGYYPFRLKFAHSDKTKNYYLRLYYEGYLHDGVNYITDVHGNNIQILPKTRITDDVLTRNANLGAALTVNQFERDFSVVHIKGDLSIPTGPVNGYNYVEKEGAFFPVNYKNFYHDYVFTEDSLFQDDGELWCKNIVVRSTNHLGNDLVDATFTREPGHHLVHRSDQSYIFMDFLGGDVAAPTPQQAPYASFIYTHEDNYSISGYGSNSSLNFMMRIRSTSGDLSHLIIEHPSRLNNQIYFPEDVFMPDFTGKHTVDEDLYNFQDALGNNTNIATIGQTVTYSDFRLKSDVEYLAPDYSKLFAIEGVSYLRHMNSKIGFIAQHIESEFPEVIRETISKTKTVNYDIINAYVLELLKAVNKRVSLLESEQFSSDQEYK